HWRQGAHSVRGTSGRPASHRRKGAGMTDVLTYDSFTPGTELGHWEESVDAGLIATWESLFGDNEQDRPARQTGLCVALMMRAFLKVVAPRPPGNIHARQIMTLESL